MAVLRTAIDWNRSSPGIDTTAISMNVLRTFIDIAVCMPRFVPAASILVRMARDTGQPVINAFDLYLLARKLFRDRGYEGQAIAPSNRELTASRARRLISEATFDTFQLIHDPQSSRRLARDRDFRSVLYVTGEGTAVEVMMTADPLCYLSHASALAHHGLAPESTTLHISAPASPLWRANAINYMSRALDFDVRGEDVDDDDLPFELTMPLPSDQVRGRAVSRHETHHPLGLAILGGDTNRVSPIGETFKDALDTPAWCGGIDNVIAIWRRHALVHREAIIAAIDSSQEKILRVRAGYLLEEVLGLSDPRVERWATDAQRGSSRKLDATAPYANRFSARWMLSINSDDMSLPSMVKT